MARLIKKDRGNYTNISNVLSRDSRLSWKSRGIFLYLWGQANEWQFYVNEVSQHSVDGVKSLRSGLDELEKFGYLKRINRHSESGSFDGMDWILDDTGNLRNDRHDHFGDDAQMAQNQPKMCQNTSDAKGVQPEKGSTQKGTLRNNNIKNYQQQEISIESNKSKGSTSKKVEHVPYKEVIDYLNKKVDKSYRYQTKSYQKLIKARFEEGYSLEDFKKVIDNKAFEWQGTTMWKYMRPSTLFRASKFDDYLNANDLSKQRNPSSGGYEELLGSAPNIDDIPDEDLPF